MQLFANNFSLLSSNTFNINALARHYATFSTIEQLRQIIVHCHDNHLPWFVLGGGSNIIFTKDFEGVVIHPVARDIEFLGEDMVVVQAGMEWDELVAWSVEQGLGGLENLSFIPGSVGAAPVQNIGAYGAEAKDMIAWVEFFDTETLCVERLSGQECDFGYRESIFKRELRSRAIVLRVAFRLSKCPQFNIDYGDLSHQVEILGGATLANIRQAVIAIRQSKLPDPKVMGNAGSFFKNPVVTTKKAEKLRSTYAQMPSYPLECGVKIPAGWLIEQAGFKGKRIGQVGVHPQQALVIVNYGGATGSEVVSFSEQVQAAVFDKFAITIHREVNVL